MFAWWPLSCTYTHRTPDPLLTLPPFTSNSSLNICLLTLYLNEPNLSFTLNLDKGTYKWQAYTHTHTHQTLRQNRSKLIKKIFKHIIFELQFDREYLRTVKLKVGWMGGRELGLTKILLQRPSLCAYDIMLIKPKLSVLTGVSWQNTE